MFEISVDNAPHDRNALKFSNCKLGWGGSGETDAGFPQMTLRQGIIKNLNAFDVAKFFANLMEKFPIYVVVEVIENYVSLRRNSYVKFVDLGWEEENTVHNKQKHF